MICLFHIFNKSEICDTAADKLFNLIKDRKTHTRNEPQEFVLKTDKTFNKKRRSIVLIRENYLLVHTFFCLF